MVFDSGEASRASCNVADMESNDFEVNELSRLDRPEDSLDRAEFSARPGMDSETRSKVKVAAASDHLGKKSSKNVDEMNKMQVENNNDAQMTNMQIYPSCSTKDNGLPGGQSDMDYSQADDVTAESGDVTAKSGDVTRSDDSDLSSDEETVCSQSSRDKQEGLILKNGRYLRSRRNRRPVQERVRQRRQTMQDMARPLKHWLYRNRASPYPSKAQKLELAHSSHMTLTQVSNWFANARRRLKNTVTDPRMTWKDRVMNYNDFVKGNAELLSISSGDEEEEEEEETGSECGTYDVSNAPMPGAAPCRISVATDSNQEQENNGSPSSAESVRLQHRRSDQQKREGGGCMNPPVPVQAKNSTSRKERSSKSNAEQNISVSSPDECNSLLHRYLQDSWQHFPQEDEYDRRRHQSGSLSSHDFEDMSISSRGSPIHSGYEDYPHSLEELTKYWEECADRVDDLYWKEISAALTLTSLARSKQRLGNPH